MPLGLSSSSSSCSRGAGRCEAAKHQTKSNPYKEVFFEVIVIVVVIVVVVVVVAVVAVVAVVDVVVFVLLSARLCIKSAICILQTHLLTNSRQAPK